MKVLIIDNYDSYTYNLFQLIAEVLLKSGIPSQVDVHRPQELTRQAVLEYDRAVISPGPGSPADASFAISHNILQSAGAALPVLGVCLGMQGLAHAFGGKVIEAAVPMHGKTSIVVHDGRGVFQGVPQGLTVMRYHSLVVDRAKIPACLEISAVTCGGKNTSFRRALSNGNNFEIMGLRHRELPVEGVQFHPESFQSEYGRAMISNFLFGRAGLVTESAVAAG